MMKRDRELATRLLLHHEDRVVAHVGPGHAVHIAPPLPSVEQQGECESLFRADRPSILECRNLSVRPRANFLNLSPLDTERMIMSKPSDVDCMTDQHAQ